MKNNDYEILRDFDELRWVGVSDKLAASRKALIAKLGDDSKWAQADVARANVFFNYGYFACLAFGRVDLTRKGVDQLNAMRHSAEPAEPATPTSHQQAQRLVDKFVDGHGSVVARAAFGSAMAHLDQVYEFSDTVAALNDRALATWAKVEAKRRTKRFKNLGYLDAERKAMTSILSDLKRDH